MDFVNAWSKKAEIPAARFVCWLGISSSKFYAWRQRYGMVNEHNGKIPRDFWLEAWEREAILLYHDERVAGAQSGRALAPLEWKDEQGLGFSTALKAP